MHRNFFKLFSAVRPGMRFTKSALTLSNPAKFGTFAASSSLLALLYFKTNSQFTNCAEAEYHEVQTIKAADLKEGEMKEVQVGPTKDDVILLSHVNGKYHATGAKCPHVGAPLEKGVLFDNKVLCPFHNAAFSVEDGQPDQGPVFSGVPVYDIREEKGVLVVKVPKQLKLAADVPMVGRSNDDSRKFVILGGGPAGLSAAETLRQSGFGGEIIIITNEDTTPYDRTVLSKNMFKLELPKITIKDQAHYDKYGINVIKSQDVQNVDVKNRTVHVNSLGDIKYDKLLVATGGRPRVPPVPGVDLQNVFTLRSYKDMEKIKNAVNNNAKNIVIIGGSFIGMETASNIKSELKDKVNVTVIEMTKAPFERALGREVGQALQSFHEQNGVKFQLEASVKAIEGSGSAKEVVLSNGTKLPADVVIMGVGVRPNSDAFAKSLDLAQDGGIHADKYLRTSDPNVFAAGDVASIPFWYTGRRERIEHYNEAIQQGMIAAYNMLGKEISHDAIPFFWTRQYDKSVQYVGFGSQFDSVYVDGSTDKFDFIAYYGLGDKVVASASMGRSPAAMIISQAMQVGVMPTFQELKSGKVSVQDIRQRVQEKKGKNECKRRTCQHKKVASN